MYCSHLNKYIKVSEPYPTGTGIQSIKLNSFVKHTANFVFIKIGLQF